jgi:uncharacterized protein YrrD
MQSNPNPTQGNPIYKKWSDLKGMAVIAIDNGKKIGTIDDFYFDTKMNSLVAFVVKTGVFSHRAFLATTINAVGADAVTTTSESALVKGNDQETLQGLPRGEQLLQYRVLSEGGTLVGNVGNILLDVTTPTAISVVGFELAAGMRAHISRNYPTFDARSVTSYGHDVLIIPDTIAQSFLS